jgi:transposase-like protein
MQFTGSRLTAAQSKKMLEFFVAGVPAQTAAELAGINRNSANLFYNKLRLIIVHFTELELPFLNGEVEADESYFGGARKGKQGRGAADKDAVQSKMRKGRSEPPGVSSRSHSDRDGRSLRSHAGFRQLAAAGSRTRK